MTRARRAVPIHVPSRHKTENMAALSRTAPPPPSLVHRWRAAPPPEAPRTGALGRALAQAAAFARPVAAPAEPARPGRPSAPPPPRPLGPMIDHAVTYEHAALVNPLARAWRRLLFWLRAPLRRLVRR